jgi:hypothetical protein
MTKTVINPLDEDAEDQIDKAADEVDPDDEIPMSDEVDADDDEVDEDDPLAGLTETQRAAVAAQIKKSNDNAVKWRKKATGKFVPATPGPKPTPPKRPAPAGGEVDLDAMKAELRAEMAAEATTARIQTEARSALRDAGLTLDAENKTLQRKALDRAIRLLDLEGAEDADDVELAVAELKQAMPGLFTKRRAKPTAGGASGPRSGAGGSRKNPAGKIASLFE